jgi:glutathione S-transferase
MKVYFSPSSPFVRKVLVCANELGIADKIALLPSAAGPVKRDATIIADNPLGQVPTFFTDDGMALYDSRVICEYLDVLAGGHALFPAPGPARWQALVDQSVADGILDAALLTRYETAMRPEALRWPDWMAGQMSKVTDALAKLEADVSGFGARVDIGVITVGCALSYLDLRFPDNGWRDRCPGLKAWYESFSQRPSMVATALK